MKIFKITDRIEIVCDTASTRNGFKHVATLMLDGQEQGNVKCNYLNRTWEKYTYQSVLEKMISNSSVLSAQDKQFCFKYVEDYSEQSPFNTVATVAAMGEIFGKTTKEKNDWKERMLKAGLENKGLIMPEDWGQLSEEEKEKRLNAVIKNLM